MRRYDEQAKRFCEAIKIITNNDDAINNFERYLSYHFSPWLHKYACTVDGLVDELERFAHMYDERAEGINE